MARITTKVQRFRQWFTERYGTECEDHQNWVCPQPIADTWRAYMFDLPTEPLSFNAVQKYMREIQTEVNISGEFNTMFDSDGNSNMLPAEIPVFDPTVVVKRKAGTGIAQSAEAAAESMEPVNVEPQCIDDMEFPNFKLHRTGTAVDRIDSDFEADGGQYGGCVTICTGESGVGKSTVLIDKLAKYKEQNPDIKLCYLSTEMTRNDLFFYRQKNPKIGQVPTVLSTDYMDGGRLKQAVFQIFEGDYDIILLDSYQDLLGTMKDLCDITEGTAQRMIIGLMIEAAEKRGTTVLAIQHLTKGGQYVGSTFLKHKTTAMMHFKFDQMGNRFVEYSKNRRGGSMQDKPLYYSMNDSGEIIYDKERFETLLNTENNSKAEHEKTKEYNDNFEKLMNDAIDREDKKQEQFKQHDNDETSPNTLYDEVNESTSMDDGDAIKAARNVTVPKSKNVVEAISELAEEVEFEEINI